jgi:hypothetical protein
LFNEIDCFLSILSFKITHVLRLRCILLWSVPVACLECFWYLRFFDLVSCCIIKKSNVIESLGMSFKHHVTIHNVRTAESLVHNTTVGPKVWQVYSRRCKKPAKG